MFKPKPVDLRPRWDLVQEGEGGRLTQWRLRLGRLRGSFTTLEEAVPDVAPLPLPTPCSCFDCQRERRELEAPGLPPINAQPAAYPGMIEAIWGEEFISSNAPVWSDISTPAGPPV